MRHKLVVAELAATCVATVMAIVTIAWPQWIELAFRIDPDHRGGAFELLITGLLIAVAVASAIAVRAQIRRGHAAANMGDAR